MPCFTVSALRARKVVQAVAIDSLVKRCRACEKLPAGRILDLDCLEVEIMDYLEKIMA